MSKTLWIYGDSFGVDWKVDWGWHRQLAGQLNVDKVVNQCCSGCANEWSAKNFRDDQHSKGDIVIFFLTNPARQWFWEDKPHYDSSGKIFEKRSSHHLL